MNEKPTWAQFQGAAQQVAIVVLLPIFVSLSIISMAGDLFNANRCNLGVCFNGHYQRKAPWNESVYYERESFVGKAQPRPTSISDAISRDCEEEREREGSRWWANLLLDLLYFVAIPLWEFTSNYERSGATCCLCQKPSSLVAVVVVVKSFEDKSQMMYIPS